MPNNCVECGVVFEPERDLWLFCDTCDRARVKAMASDFNRILQNAESDPDHADQKDEIRETRSQLLKDIYGTL